VDWPAICASLMAIGYSGPLALESRLSGPAQDVLPRVPALLRRYI
jgi:sugar phosphate isomerase/epimerase